MDTKNRYCKTCHKKIMLLLCERIILKSRTEINLWKNLKITLIVKYC